MTANCTFFFMKIKALTMILNGKLPAKTLECDQRCKYSRHISGIFRLNKVCLTDRRQYTKG